MRRLPALLTAGALLAAGCQSHHVAQVESVTSASAQASRTPSPSPPPESTSYGVQALKIASLDGVSIPSCNEGINSFTTEVFWSPTCADAGAQFFLTTDSWTSSAVHAHGTLQITEGQCRCTHPAYGLSVVFDRPRHLQFSGKVAIFTHMHVTTYRTINGPPQPLGRLADIDLIGSDWNLMLEGYGYPLQPE